MQLFRITCIRASNRRLWHQLCTDLRHQIRQVLGIVERASISISVSRSGSECGRDSVPPPPPPPAGGGSSIAAVDLKLDFKLDFKAYFSTGTATAEADDPPTRAAAVEEEEEADEDARPPQATAASAARRWLVVGAALSVGR